MSTTGFVQVLPPRIPSQRLADSRRNHLGQMLSGCMECPELGEDAILPTPNMPNPATRSEIPRRRLTSTLPPFRSAACLRARTSASCCSTWHATTTSP